MFDRLGSDIEGTLGTRARNQIERARVIGIKYLADRRLLQVPPLPGHDLAGHRDGVGIRLFGHERKRRPDPGFRLGSQRGGHRPEHLRKRGAATGGSHDDRRQHDHAERP